MFKAGTLLLTVCLFAGATFAQDDPKAGPDSDAVIKNLQETLAKSQAALEASRAAEAKAREEAEVQRDRAEKLLYAAELERAQALEASKVAELQQLQAIRQAEAVKAEAIVRKVADADGEILKASEPDAKERKGKRGGKRKANIAALEKQVELLTRQMQDVQAKLNALQDQISGLPSANSSSKHSGNVFDAKGPLKKSNGNNDLKQPVKDPKPSKKTGLAPGKASN